MRAIAGIVPLTLGEFNHVRIKKPRSANRPSLKYHFTNLAKAQAWARGLIADGYHTVEVLRFAHGEVDILETLRA